MNMTFLPMIVEWNVDPVMFSVFGLEIRYYGLMWALAIVLGAKCYEVFCKHEGLNPQLAESIFAYGALSTVIGSRLGHCLFYDPVGYLSAPWTIITGFRDGGMASHGAAIGLLIGLWLCARKCKLPYIWLLDRIIPGVTLGGALVRFGNLMNSEIFGTTTTLPWGFKFVNSHKWLTSFAPSPVHPTQIYEALCYIVTGVVLLWFYYKKDWGRRRPGLMFGWGLIGIFFTRFIIEFVKADQEEFEAGMILDMGQWLSIPFILVGLWFIFRKPTPALDMNHIIKVSGDTLKNKSSKK